MSCYLTLPCKCYHPGCQCLIFKGTKMHNRMTCVHCYHALEDHCRVDMMNNDDDLQTSTPIAHPNDYDVSNNNESLQFTSPPIATI